MRNYYRIMFGRKSVSAPACFNGGFGTDVSNSVVALSITIYQAGPASMMTSGEGKAR